MSIKTITQLDHIDARKFFLENKSYFNFDLPEYYNFEPLLKDIFIVKYLIVFNKTHFCLVLQRWVFCF